jgi:hypothetical protein
MGQKLPFSHNLGLPSISMTPYHQLTTTTVRPVPTIPLATAFYLEEPCSTEMCPHTYFWRADVATGPSLSGLLGQRVLYLHNNAAGWPCDATNLWFWNLHSEVLKHESVDQHGRHGLERAQQHANTSQLGCSGSGRTCSRSDFAESSSPLGECIE